MNFYEDFYYKFRENTIGYNKLYETNYGWVKMIYADWTASGRLYCPIECCLVNTFGPYVGNTHTQSSVTGSTMTECYEYAKKLIKHHVNADEYDVLIPTDSGMTGAVNKLQRILGLKLPSIWKNHISLNEQNRPLILVTHMEHHSNHLSWLETIGDVICLQPDCNGLIDLDYLEATLDKFKHRSYKIGAFTACSNVTGIITPIHEMAKLMHLYGGICFIDFSACAPYIKMDMHPKDPLEKLDGIFFSPHKFLGGPGTSGILIFDSRLYNSNSPDNPGGGTVLWTNPWGEYHYVPEIEARETGGTPPFMQTIKASLCISLKDEMKINYMLKREKELVTILLKGLSEIREVYILADNVKDRLAIVSFNIEDIHYNLVVKILSDYYGIQCRGGCSCAGTYGHYLLNLTREESHKITNEIDGGNLANKPGWIRISLHPMMKSSEVRFIIYAVKDIIKNKNRFKRDYIYDPKTNEFKHFKEFKQSPQRIRKWFKI